MDKEERREYDKRYREANPGYYAKKSKEWRKANPEKSREYNRKWDEAHPGYRAKKAKEWHKAHPGYATAKTREWRDEHPGYSTMKSKEWNKANPEKRRQLTDNYRGDGQDAKLGNQPWDDADDLWLLKHASEYKIKDLAETLGRSYSATQQRLAKLRKQHEH